MKTEPINIARKIFSDVFNIPSMNKESRPDVIKTASPVTANSWIDYHLLRFMVLGSLSPTVTVAVWSHSPSP